MDADPEQPAIEPKKTLGERYRDLKARYQDLVAQFGKIAIITHFTIGFFTYWTFVALITLGVDVEGAGEGSGLLASAWVAYKLTMPVRIMITLALTPIVATAWNRLRGREAPVEPAAAPAAAAEGEAPPVVDPS